MDAANDKRHEEADQVPLHIIIMTISCRAEQYKLRCECETGRMASRTEHSLRSCYRTVGTLVLTLSVESSDKYWVFGGEQNVPAQPPRLAAETTAPHTSKVELLWRNLICRLILSAASD